ncbi:hypothetical protein RRG08_024451 [Elysia crispata]|uniref:Uncharacterized protein n=1 Tax=Elysia crispata TaxID=231223 RepID=A0AAE0YP58_9GAST|nr:hypothetical protein RRG08_024451 [Elysia crispata]
MSPDGIQLSLDQRLEIWRRLEGHERQAELETSLRYPSKQSHHLTTLRPSTHELNARSKARLRMGRLLPLHRRAHSAVSASPLSLHLSYHLELASDRSLDPHIDRKEQTSPVLCWHHRGSGMGRETTERAGAPGSTAPDGGRTATELQVAVQPDPTT